MDITTLILLMVAVGCVVSVGLAVIVFALWLEQFTRNYGENL